MAAMEEMTLQDVIENALGLHMVFWALGFESDDIYVTGDPEKICVMLRTQGTQFVCVAGPRTCDEQTFRAAWLDLLHRWNQHEIPKDQAMSMYRRTGIPANALKFVLALHDKGIHSPRASEDLVNYVPIAQA